MTNKHTAFCFAQRILNPFRGAMHIVRLKWSEAVTTDGKNWTLYIRGEKFYEDLQESNDEHIIVPDIKYGTWSKAEDFSHAPVRLTTLYEEIDFEGQQLLEAVKHAVDKLPFPYIDHHELWLLDETTQQPLALIGSRCEHEFAEMPPLLRWTAGHAAVNFFPKLATLQQQVNLSAGKKPVARWFDRNREHLPASEIAVELLARDTPESLEQLIEWQSPYHLLLTLEIQQRITFEKMASRHALRLVEQLALYPAIAQPEIITAARVEACMRNSGGQKIDCDPPDTSIPPFYLEMGD
jgi:hypothetical protein